MISPHLRDSWLRKASLIPTGVRDSGHDPAAVFAFQRFPFLGRKVDAPSRKTRRPSIVQEWEGGEFPPVKLKLAPIADNNETRKPETLDSCYLRWSLRWTLVTLIQCHLVALSETLSSGHSASASSTGRGQLQHH